MSEPEPLRAVELLSFRECADEDEPFLLELFASTRPAELEALGLEGAPRDAFLRSQLGAQHGSWRHAFPDAERLIVLVDGEVAGRFFVHQDDAAATIIDVTLSPGYRGRALGTRLLRLVLTQAAGAGLPVLLQVERGSRAEALYERLGFRVDGAPDGGDDVDEEDDRPGDLRVSMRWDTVDLEPLTAEGFEAYVGDDFGCTAANGAAKALTLARVARGRPRSDGRDPFSLFFDAPVDLGIDGDRQLLTHPLIGGLVLFVVPLGPRKGRFEYEAVFG